MERDERKALAEKRLKSVLSSHGIATARTLEQKISDAGPANQRVDPHVLTSVRNELVQSGELARVQLYNAAWYRLGNTPTDLIEERMAILAPVYRAYIHGRFAKRVGQTLEIATYRALVAANHEFYGRYKNLDDHDDSTEYSKEEPPQHIGSKSLPGDQRLDFLVRHPDSTVGILGIECKNVREWLYPDRSEIIETLEKCLTLDAVPVLIARRFPFVTFKLLSACGIIVHQTYNQLVPSADADLAAKAKDKNLLGYHDIRLGNEPDARLTKFIGMNLMEVAPEARKRFNENRDLLEKFVSREYDYRAFAARLRRRLNGQSEDFDFD